MDFGKDSEVSREVSERTPNRLGYKCDNVSPGRVLFSYSPVGLSLPIHMWEANLKSAWIFTRPSNYWTDINHQSKQDEKST